MYLIHILSHRWRHAQYRWQSNLRNLVNLRVLIDRIGPNGAVIKIYCTSSSNLTVYIVCISHVFLLMQFVWQPYGEPTIDGLIMDNMPVEWPIWSTVAPLICFEVIEWHPVDHVMCQFGFFQYIPVEPRSLAGSHNIDLRRQGETDWRSRHINWVTLWDHRQECILQGQPAIDYQPSNEY